MQIVVEETNLLFYKIFNNTVTSKDYLEWSYRLVENGLESITLYKMLSMDEDESIFLYEEYLNKALSELSIVIPSFEEAAHSYIRLLCKAIIKNDQNNFDLVKQIFKVTYQLDYPSDLSVWLRLDDEVDRLIYDDEYYKPDETDLRETILLEAKSYINRFEIKGTEYHG